MKNLIILLTLSCFTYMASAQCSRYYPLEKGTTFTYDNLNKKGKSDGITHYKVSDVSTAGGITTATMEVKLTDAKGKESFSSDYSFTCDGDVVRIDYQSLMNTKMLEQFKDMEMEITGTDVELPNNLNVGQDLADANVAVSINMSGMNMKMNVDTVNRKVEKKETITTSAGTFDCYVIYSEIKSKMMMTNQTFPSRLWLAEGVGLVKQETYNKNGKLMGSTVLTSLEM
ncbi:MULTISPECIES: hypothetical protein [Croceivirga]|uniref:DUF3108 domain-containing protein n=1 Tax=Croceivirga radicis TaxID=1929488 RepID=A0A1V6LNR3_9FLAO|nr:MULTISPECIES: hypothetical protein [Croceivirga]NJB37882.1 hypothetical protein [Croceivirga sp. JEA036]OQD41831.1 hypothetical protein BUL40_13310 [Croceivirga radicis]